MPESNESTGAAPAPGEQAPQDTLGDILRKERISRRIAAETIAKDLKLNVSYIKALESDEYNELPADPYIRVYLRSIARYLNLDPEDILKRFYARQGIAPETYKKDASTKLDVSKVEPEKPHVPWIVISLIIAVLAGFSFLAGKMGWIAPAGPQPPAKARATADSSKPADSARPRSTAAADSVPMDSLSRIVAQQESASVAAVQPHTPTDSAKPLNLQMRVLRDSVWIQAFADGQSWKKTLYANERKVLSAKDSINVHVGRNAEVEYLLDGRKMRRFRDAGVVIFKLDKSRNPQRWTQAQWQATFGSRR